MDETLKEILRDLIEVRSDIESQRNAVETAITRIVARLDSTEDDPGRQKPAEPADSAVKLYHPKEAAALLGISTRTLDRIRMEGLIKCIRLYPTFKGHRYTWQQLQDFITGREKAAAVERENMRRKIRINRSE